MKGKKPTREQRKLLQENKLDTYKWYVQKDTPNEMQLVHADTGEIKIVKK